MDFYCGTPLAEKNPLSSILRLPIYSIKKDGRIAEQDPGKTMQESVIPNQQHYRLVLGYLVVLGQ